MKILIIELCNYIDYPTGGHLSFCKNLLKAFDEGLALVGYAIDDKMPLRKWTQVSINGKTYDYFAVARCKKDSRKPFLPARLKGYAALRRNRRKILSYPCDMIFFQTPEVLFSMPASVYCKSLLMMPGVENAIAISRYSWARKIAPFYEKCFFRRARHIPYILATADTNEIDDFVSRSCGMLKREQIQQFPTRYDAQIFHVMDQEFCRKELGWPVTKKILTTVGRLAEFKGWRLMLEAFAILCREDDSYLFYYIGNGEDLDYIREFVATHNLQSNIIMTGQKSQEYIAKALNAADLFVMGSIYEGWSTTLVEACACGVPAVVTVFSSAADMIKNGNNGYVIESRSPAMFAAGCRQALDLNRNRVIEFNQRYKSFAINNMSREFATLEQKLSTNRK